MSRERGAATYCRGGVNGSRVLPDHKRPDEYRASRQVLILLGVSEEKAVQSADEAEQPPGPVRALGQEGKVVTGERVRKLPKCLSRRGRLACSRWRASRGGGVSSRERPEDQELYALVERSAGASRAVTLGELRSSRSLGSGRDSPGLRRRWMGLAAADGLGGGRCSAEQRPPDIGSLGRPQDDLRRVCVAGYDGVSDRAAME